MHIGNIYGATTQTRAKYLEIRMNPSNWAVTIYICGISLLGGLIPAGAQSDVPPPEMLDAIFPALRHKVAPKPPPKVSISRASDQPQNPPCDLTPLRLTARSAADILESD